MRNLSAGDPRRLGSFTLLGVLGAGGMATVYLATEEHSHANSTLAVVKALRVDRFPDSYIRLLFGREIEALGNMNAKGTLRLLACDPNGEPPWFATEYIPGMDLHRLVSLHGPLHTEAVLRLAAEIARTLVDLQKNKIVHRDLKPSNILVLSTGDGSLRLIDFGVARILDRDQTRPAMRVGTDAFMAPEQLDGDAGYPSDMFALGLTLVYAATGTEAERHDIQGPEALRPGSFSADAFDHLTDPLPGLVRACTRQEPAARVTARDLLTLLADHGVRPRGRGAGGSTWLPDTARTSVLEHVRRTRRFLPEPRDEHLPRTRALPRTNEPETAWVHHLDGRAYFTSPVDVAEGIVVCSLDGAVRLLDASDGHILWKRDLGVRIEHTPASGHGMLYVPCSDRTLLALDTSDGSHRWSYIAGDSGVFTPVVAGDKVLVGARDGSVHCLCALTGSRLWVSSRGKGPVFDRPTVAGDRIYVSGWQGTLQALSVHDGSRPMSLPRRQDLVGAPAWYADTLILSSRTGTLCAIDTRTGRERWLRCGSDSACTGPVVGRDLCYVATTGGTLWAHDVKTGAPAWQFAARGRLRSVPVHHDGTLYIGSDDMLTAADSLTGAVRWAHRTDGTMHAPPLITRGHAYIGTWNCTVQALALPTPAAP
ncbi:PQQ-binding-like beta-propeller repeat protein [Streptomyces sp. PAM3C]|uniref:serine/threonine-protein kinase n=1 Tax=Streptomyces sp. PAM3C TaxID=2847300 RepID=UPI001C1E190C|nr:serine/threonine-protein kinase [Streptomyces sp. PAM3C]MBU5943251.1 PQQ-binding-like beta-propeller repeat protein [Streptomyces sp. PAM3C]